MMDKKQVKRYAGINAMLNALIVQEPDWALFVKLQRLGADIIDAHKNHQITRQQYCALRAAYGCAMEIYRAELGREGREKADAESV